MESVPEEVVGVRWSWWSSAVCFCLEVVGGPGIGSRGLRDPDVPEIERSRGEGPFATRGVRATPTLQQCVCVCVSLYSVPLLWLSFPPA
jgi:hypothetical protein